MKLFKKKINAYDFGKSLYLMILDFLFNKDSPVELEKLISTLSKGGECQLSNNHEIEAIVALAYQTSIIILNKFEQDFAYIILKGMMDRFIIHVKELGCPDSDLENLKRLFTERLEQYYEADKLQSSETVQEWVIIFLQNFLSDSKGFLNAFLWFPVAQFITEGTELMSNYIQLFLNKYNIAN